MKRYVGLEGVDGSGKSTVAQACREILETAGERVVLVREPGGTELGEEIRRLLLHSHEMVGWAEAALFAAQRAQLAAEVVRPALDGGAWVLSDRTYYSSLAYQGAARGLGIDKVRALNEACLDGVLPDVVVVLDVDPKVALARQSGIDRIGSAGLEFQREVAAGYRHLARVDTSRVIVVDGSGSPDVIARGIIEEAMR
ncbi:MAG: dTMP kinase [Acidimicrobiia bacterium]|nr:dTMP kinase [Acidimicrobiia bacterium]